MSLISFDRDDEVESGRRRRACRARMPASFLIGHIPRALLGRSWAPTGSLLLHLARAHVRARRSWVSNERLHPMALPSR